MPTSPPQPSPPDHPAQVRAIADDHVKILREIADDLGRDYDGYAEELRAAATRIEQLEQAIEYVASTFERSEAQGYRSRDRQFAIELLRRVLPAPPAAPAAPTLNDAKIDGAHE